MQYGFVEPRNAAVVLALGGDALMLPALHQQLDSDTPIYGLNCGSVGFLSIDIREENLAALHSAGRIDLN